MLGNPLFAHLFMRFSNLEARLIQEKADLLQPYGPWQLKDLIWLLTSPTEVLTKHAEEDAAFGRRLNLADAWCASATDNSMVVIPADIPEIEMDKLRRMTPLAKAIAILTPAFTQVDYALTEQGALELFAQVEEVDPTPKPATVQYEGTNDAANRIPEPTVQ